MSTRLSYSFYNFCYYSWVACILGFVPLLWSSWGFSPSQVGLLGAVPYVTGVIAPTFILRLALYWGYPWKVIRASNLLCLLISSCFFFQPPFAFLLPLWFTFLLAMKHQVLVDSFALEDASPRTFRFEQVRIWGSVGFICITFLFGRVADRCGTQAIMVFPIAIVCLMLLGTFLLRDLRDRPFHSPGSNEQAAGYLGKRYLLLLLLACTGMAAHSPAYLYLSLYLKALGWSANSIGMAWNLGVVAEITLFYFVSRIGAYLTLPGLLLTSSILALCRWTLLTYVSNPTVILCSQLLHAFSFGGTYIAGIKLIPELVTTSNQPKAVATFQSVSMAGGVLLGAIFTNYFVQDLLDYREVQSLFNLSIAFCIVSLGASLMLWRLGVPKR